MFGVNYALPLVRVWGERNVIEIRVEHRDKCRGLIGSWGWYGDVCRPWRNGNGLIFKYSFHSHSWVEIEIKITSSALFIETKAYINSWCGSVSVACCGSRGLLPLWRTIVAYVGWKIFFKSTY